MLEVPTCVPMVGSPKVVVVVLGGGGGGGCTTTVPSHTPEISHDN